MIPGMQNWFNIRTPINVIYYIHKIKTQNYMITSINTEKAFGKKNQHRLMKILKKLVIEGNVFNLIKSIYEKPKKTSYFMVTDWILSL